MDDDDPMSICCAGRPMCDLDAAVVPWDVVAARMAECGLCKRIVFHADGSHTVIERTVN